MVTFDRTLDLIEVVTETNELGDSITTEKENTIFCKKQSVTRSEHYAAMQSGYKPEIVFVVNHFEYNNETLLNFEGKRYRVLRTYRDERLKNDVSIDALELVCEGVDH